MIITALLCMMAGQMNGQSAAQQRLGVDEMFTLAEQSSKALRPTRSGVTEAEHGVDVARSARLPEVSVGLSLSYLGNGTIADRNFSHTMKADMPHFGNNFQVEATQVVYTGGAIDAGIRMAELAVKQAQIGEELTRQDVRMLLVGEYLDLYKMLNARRVYERNIGLTRRVLDDLGVRYEQGTVLQNDITRLDLQLSSLQLALTQTQNTISILNRNLATTLGLGDVEIMPDTTLLDQQFPDITNAEWAQTALGTSARLQQLGVAVDMAGQQRRIAHADYIPDIAIVATNHLDGPITIEVPPIDKNFNYWYVGVGVKYNLSSLFKARHSVRKSDMAIRRANEQLDAAREQTLLQTNEAYTRYVETFAQRATQEKNVVLARQNYDVVVSRYAEGMALITDMLDAANTLLDAELQLVNAQINTVFSYYKLKYISNTL